jgi:hypothetical protein
MPGNCRAFIFVSRMYGVISFLALFDNRVSYCLNLDFQEYLDDLILIFFLNHGNPLILSNHGSRLIAP